MATLGRLSPPIDTRAADAPVSPKYKRKFRSKLNHSLSFPPPSAYQLSSITGNGGLPRRIRKPKKIVYLLVVFFLLYWFGLRHGLGRERIYTPLGYAVKGGRQRKSSLRFDKLGLAVLDGQPEAGAEHPIYELMERGEERWHELVTSQSKTLEDAAAEYKRRYAIDPPAGFDRWWKFCEEHGVVVRDEYKQLMKDLLPHHALEPATFIKRSKELQEGVFVYNMEVTQKSVTMTGPRAFSGRPRMMESLVGGFLSHLPKDFQLKVTISDHDTGSEVLGEDQRSRAMELVREGGRESCHELNDTIIS